MSRCGNVEAMAADVVGVSMRITTSFGRTGAKTSKSGDLRTVTVRLLGLAAGAAGPLVAAATAAWGAGCPLLKILCATGDTSKRNLRKKSKPKMGAATAASRNLKEYILPPNSTVRWENSHAGIGNP
ncbi:MAG: hypothetical protein AN484_28540, partial [Aphanizomenon flos-aquae WA102]